MEKEEKALEFVEDGGSLREAARKYNIPYSTLHYRLEHKNCVRGHYLTQEEEDKIMALIEERQKGYPITRQEILDLVNEFMKVSFFFFKI
jgi:Zn-dependent peptidase ImmA (M78 family)